MKTYRNKYRKSWLARSLAVAGVVLLSGAVMATASAASKESKLVIGVEAWPGVTVKTQIASDILEALGYQVKTLSADTPFILHGLSHGSVDFGFGGWYPISKSMIQPLVDQKKIVRVTANLKNALSGMAVPTYVHEAGVDSVKDLHKYAKKFHKKIYGIEAGSTWNTGVRKLIKEDKYDLGDWSIVATSTAAMLTEVKRAIHKKNWIVFYGWKPHWMNISYDLYYLTTPTPSPVIHTEATVYTLARKDFAKDHPNVNTFLKNFHVKTKTQSEWINEFSHKKGAAEDVSHDWIASHLDTVKTWLKGVRVKGSDKPAFAAVKAKFGG